MHREPAATYRRRRIGALLVASLLVAGAIGAISVVRSAVSGTDAQTSSGSAPTTSTTVGAPASLLCARSATVEALDARTRLAQLLFVGVDEDGLAAGDAREAVEEEGVGGVFLTSAQDEPIDAAVVEEAALDELRSPDGLPAFVGADVEGGEVQRVDGVGELAAAADLATVDDATIQQEAERVGNDLRDIGISVDFAPVVDVTDGDVGGASSRTFGDTAAEVVDHAGAFAQGLRDAGLLPVLKHFPGHGGLDGDPHVEIVTGPSLADLEDVDLIPFRELTAAEPTAVMVGHQIVPGLTAAQPASMSERAIDYLRDEMGFDGLVLSDEQARMAAVESVGSVPDTVLASLQAGIDMALWTDPPTASLITDVVDRLVEALETGDLDEEQVNRSVARVLRTKRLLSDDPPVC